jgi:hypothetical protein
VFGRCKPSENAIGTFPGRRNSVATTGTKTPRFAGLFPICNGHSHLSLASREMIYPGESIVLAV